MWVVRYTCFPATKLYRVRVMIRCKTYTGSRFNCTWALQHLVDDLKQFFLNTVKPEYNDHPRDPKFEAVVDRWSLFRGSFMLQKLKIRPQNGGRWR